LIAMTTNGLKETTSRTTCYKHPLSSHKHIRLYKSLNKDNTEHMDYLTLIDKFDGDIQKAAYILGVTSTTLFNWRKRGIPKKSLELVTFKTERYMQEQQQRMELESERYERLISAMTEVVKIGVSPDTLYTLTFETGFSDDDLLIIVNKSKEEQK